MQSNYWIQYIANSTDQRNVFLSDTALLNALYFATFDATKKWTATIFNWVWAYGKMSIMYEERLPE